MRSLLITAAIFTSSVFAMASGTNPDGKDIYLNKHMEVIDKKKEAVYLCEIVAETEEGYHAKAYFLSGELKMEGWFADEALTQPHGTFTYYYQNGQVESEGSFRDGSKFGLWQRYDFEGNPKSEKIYATLQMMQAIEAFKH